MTAQQKLTDLVALVAPYLHEPNFVSTLRSLMLEYGMDDEQADECLGIFLPQVREQAAKALH